MKTFLMRTVIVLFSSTFLLASLSYGAEQAATLDELLKLIKSAAINESKDHRQREKEFLGAKTEQTRLLKKAKAEIDKDFITFFLSILSGYLIYTTNSATEVYRYAIIAANVAKEMINVN